MVAVITRKYEYGVEKVTRTYSKEWFRIPVYAIQTFSKLTWVYRNPDVIA